MDNNLQRAIALIKSGDKKQGGKLLAEIVRNDPQNVNAWLWLSSCVNTDEQRIYCLKKVLEIDPNNSMALSALPKIQQTEQPTEEVILGKSKESQQLVSNPELKQVSPPTLNKKIKTSNFHPKYLTAVAGMVTMIGTALPWSALFSVSGLLGSSRTKIEEYSGLTVAPGIITSVVGIAIVFISIFQRTKPGKSNSLISSLFALLTFLMVLIWTINSYKGCIPDTNCYILGTGLGYGLSLFSLFLVFIFGLIPNPKEF